MSKVLVDREWLKRLHRDLDACQKVIWLGLRGADPAYCQDAQDRLKEIDELLAQPAEAEEVSNARLMNTLAELARRAPLRTLHTICETQRQVSTVKLERYLGPIGDTLAGYAFTLRIDFGKLSAALSAVTAERDRLESALIQTTTRHFAQQWKDRADDKKLDECLSEGIAMLEAERDRLREQANKFRHVERAMEALGCDEREGGIVTAASLILISSAHRMNAKRGVIDQEGVTLDGGCIGDWRVTIERISAAMAAKEA